MEDNKKLGLVSLIAIVVGSMIGGGAFNLASDMAGAASPGATILGWVITGIGMIALAFCFQNLNEKRPDLDGGVFSYATAGFGKFLGFNSAWGYWISAWLGNVAYATLVFSSIGYFIPVFEGGQTVAAIIGASILLWFVHGLVLKGVHSAALVNIVTTIAKLVPIFLFIIIGIFAFNADIFMDDFWGTGAGFQLSDVMAQTKSTMLVTLWVFIGIEGAVVLSTRAKDKKDVGKATVIGLISTLVIYILISFLSMGVMARADIAGLSNPSMAYVLESVVGPWGAIVINLGLIISVLGAWLGWTILAAEIPYLAGKEKLFPSWFAKTNKNGAPANSLWLTNGLIQVFLLTFLVTEEAYNFAFSLASSAILIPYAFTAFYQLKYSIQDKAADRAKNIFVGVVASVYAIWMVYAAGVGYLLLTMLLYAPGIVIYYFVQKEANVKQVFSKSDLAISAALVIFAVMAIYGLVTGGITI